MFGQDITEDIRRLSSMAFQSGKLTGIQSFVLWTLQDQDAYGIDKAVSIQVIQNIWNNTCTPKAPADRSIKDAVKILLEEHAVPIGSSRIPGRNGYFFCCSDADAEEAVRPYINEIHSMFRRIKVLSPKSAFVRQLNGQTGFGKESE